MIVMMWTAFLRRIVCTDSLDIDDKGTEGLPVDISCYEGPNYDRCDGQSLDSANSGSDNNFCEPADQLWVQDGTGTYFSYSDGAHDDQSYDQGEDYNRFTESCDDGLYVDYLDENYSEAYATD